jgi:hypothetical protein
MYLARRTAVAQARGWRDAMGFTGPKALQFKLAYIAAFREKNRHIVDVASEKREAIAVHVKASLVLAIFSKIRGRVKTNAS